MADTAKVGGAVHVAASSKHSFKSNYDGTLRNLDKLQDDIQTFIGRMVNYKQNLCWYPRCNNEIIYISDIYEGYCSYHINEVPVQQHLKTEQRIGQILLIIDRTRKR